MQTQAIDISINNMIELGNGYRVNQQCVDMKAERKQSGIWEKSPR